MTPSTPIARSKTAALARILDSVSKGYTRHIHGTVKASKVEALANKFHALYGVGCSPGQRLIRKSKGIANSILVLYCPDGVEDAQWLLLATLGSGVESERLRPVEDKPRLTWLGYELVRQSTQGRAAWTWRRLRHEMEEWYALIAAQAHLKHFNALGKTLECIALQPGFRGVREQSWALCEEARRRGYSGTLPHLFFLQKISHGERLALTTQPPG